jgi:hypothetical protein
MLICKKIAFRYPEIPIVVLSYCVLRDVVSQVSPVPIGLKLWATDLSL